MSLSKSAQDDAQALATPSLDAMDAQDDVPVAGASANPPASPSGLVGGGEKAATESTPNDFRSSPPVLIHDATTQLDPPNKQRDGSPEDAGAKSDSEAETIVLPGKDGHSPSKIRKSIKHEDKSDNEDLGDAPDIGNGSTSVGKAVKDARNKEDDQMTEGEDHKPNESTLATSMLGKRKRSKHPNGHGDGNGHSNLDSAPGNSSGLSSVPTSPVATTRSSLSKPGASDSDISRSPSPRLAPRDKAKSADRVVPTRKHYGSRSGDEGGDDTRRFHRQRSSGADHRSVKDRRTSLKPDVESAVQKRRRSASPHPRVHGRSASTQPSKSMHGMNPKKKRVPAPLQSTEYHSDESSASGSSHPRSSRLRHLAAPPTGDSMMSPAKIAPHKKHVNSSGQTLVARACASGKLDIVKQRLEDRPEDLDEPDHANNTPLHTASIAGHADIVKLLLDSGCIVDPVNLSRDTPLHDAIDNGHLECVKLLLSAGANPRKANGKGEDPSDLIDDEDDAAPEMRKAINAAKQRTNDVRRSSEDDQIQDNADTRTMYSKGSPHQTPPAQAHDALAISQTSRRNATTRSIKTSDRELYQPLNLNELRRAAGSNDIRTVVRILDVFNNDLDDPKSLIIAAKAGYDEVINMLFGFSVTNPDPDPLDDMPPDSATPILAAIGRESLKVIELFLSQPAFNPTRLVNGETYYEIAKKRGGSLWKEEEELLRDAFNKYNKTHPSSSGKPRSPVLRRDGRESIRDAKPPRKDEQPASRSAVRTAESESIKSQHKSSSSTGQSKDGSNSAKRGPGRPRKEDSAASMLDNDAAPLGPPKQKNQARRSDYDAIASSESETALKPRRKLVSGKEFRGERDLEKHRRPSVASNASGSSIKERRDTESNADRLARKASPNLPRSSKGPNNNDHDSTSERHADKERPRSIKRDDSKDRLTAIRGESPVKRPWKSETPPRSSMQEVMTGYEAGGGPQKKRKMDGDATSKSESKAERASSLSPDQIMTNATSNAVSSTSEKPISRSNSDAKDKEKSIRSSQKAKSSETSSDSTSKASKSAGDETSSHDPAGHAASVASKANAERKAQALLEKEELETKLQLERAARLEQERAAQEELKRQHEENERKERQRQEDIDTHAREQERQRALYLEQEKQRQKDQERRRAQLQEQQRAERARIEEQKNKERLSKLPLLLRWLDGAKDPKTPDIAVLFRIIEGFRFDTIKPEATGQPNAREQWMLNTHAAILLGEKDIQLSRCKSIIFLGSFRTNVARHCLGAYSTFTCCKASCVENPKRNLLPVRS